MSELDQAADLGDMSRFLLRMYADTDFIKGLENVRLRNKDFMGRLAGARNRLLELLTEYGLLDREIAQKAWVDVSKVEEQFGQVADAYKTDSISEEQIMREAIFLSRKLSLMPKLLKPTCTNSNCRKVLDRIKLKYEGTATCRCGTTYFGFPCKFCFSPIVAREGQDEVVCEVCGARYERRQ
jgi:hypothetical protein